MKTPEKIAALAFAFLVVGCGSEGPAGTSGTDDASIDTSMNENYPTIFSSILEDSDGALYAGDDRDGEPYLEPLADGADLPVAWGRKGTGPVREVIARTYPNRNICEVDFDRMLTGRLYVDRTDDGIRNPGVKPIADRWHRRSILVRDGEEWLLQSVSPARIGLANPESQSVFIGGITIFVDNETALVVERPEQMFDFPDELPQAAAGQVLRVEARAGNEIQDWTPSQWAFLHMQHKRYRMSDNGERGDREPGDGIYTVEIELDSPVRRILVDVVDAETLMTEFGDNYDSVAWGIPFFIPEDD